MGDFRGRWLEEPGRYDEVCLDSLPKPSQVCKSKVVVVSTQPFRFGHGRQYTRCFQTSSGVSGFATEEYPGLIGGIITVQHEYGRVVTGSLYYIMFILSVQCTLGFRRKHVFRRDECLQLLPLQEPVHTSERQD
jgi:hypothetical protein